MCIIYTQRNFLVDIAPTRYFSGIECTSILVHSIRMYQNWYNHVPEILLVLNVLILFWYIQSEFLVGAISTRKFLCVYIF